MVTHFFTVLFSTHGYVQLYSSSTGFYLTFYGNSAIDFLLLDVKIYQSPERAVTPPPPPRICPISVILVWECVPGCISPSYYTNKDLRVGIETACWVLPPPPSWRVVGGGARGDWLMQIINYKGGVGSQIIRLLGLSHIPLFNMSVYGRYGALSENICWRFFFY
jgi:hypothetical protein